MRRLHSCIVGHPEILASIPLALCHTMAGIQHVPLESIRRRWHATQSLHKLLPQQVRLQPSACMGWASGHLKRVFIAGQSSGPTIAGEVVQGCLHAGLSQLVCQSLRTHMTLHSPSSQRRIPRPGLLQAGSRMLDADAGLGSCCYQTLPPDCHVR